MENKITDKSIWAIGGITMAGVGVGLYFLQSNPIYLVACIIMGIGIGLVITSIIYTK